MTVEKNENEKANSQLSTSKRFKEAKNKLKSGKFIKSKEIEEELRTNKEVSPSARNS